MEISKKIPKWAELKNKIWPNSTTEDNINEAPFTWSVSPLENQKIKKNYRETSNQMMQFLQASRPWNFDGVSLINWYM